MTDHSSPLWGGGGGCVDPSVYQDDSGIGSWPSFTGKESKGVSPGILPFSATYVMGPRNKVLS